VRARDAVAQFTISCSGRQLRFRSSRNRNKLSSIVCWARVPRPSERERESDEVNASRSASFRRAFEMEYHEDGITRISNVHA